MASRVMQAATEREGSEKPPGTELARPTHAPEHSPQPLGASLAFNIAHQAAPMIIRRSGPCVQRTCDGIDSPEGECAECRASHNLLQRSPSGAATGGVPPIVHEVLRTPGAPLDKGTRNLMEGHLGSDLSQARVHTDERAAASARAVNALAFTVGNSIFFARGRYAPHQPEGRSLLAHELVHTIQQGNGRPPSSAQTLSVDSPNSAAESEARSIAAAPAPAVPVRSAAPVVARADPSAVSYTMLLGRTPATGIQFWPTNLTDTRVGPVSAQPGLLGGAPSRLNAIIGENLTLRVLARQILPLWTTATPFTPPGAAAPLPLVIITEDELARGLLVYNQYYLPVPAMTQWRAGLRFPLPVDIDETTGMGTLHPLQIQALAGAFQPAWVPLLETRATSTTAPPAALVMVQVATFLASEPTTLSRAAQLMARALTNAVAAVAFVRETFRQLGAGGFDVALATMDLMVNRDVQQLAAQRDGATILAQIRAALALAPAAPSATQQASLARSNLLLGTVAGAVAEAPPGAARVRAEKSVPIDTVKLAGSTHTPSTQVAVANGILSQCNVRLIHVADHVATPAQTSGTAASVGYLGHDTDLAGSSACGAATAEERRMFNGATADFGLTSRIRAFFPATLSGMGSAAGYAMPPFCATGAASGLLGMIVLSDAAGREDLAHEVGHFLLNSGFHPAGIMAPVTGRTSVRFTPAQCTTIYNNA